MTISSACMRPLSKNIYLLAVIIFMLSGCKTIVSEYCFNRAKVSDDAILWKNDNSHKEIYKVGDKYYVRGCRGRVRQTLVGLPIESAIGLWNGYTIEWEADEERMEEGFVLLQRETHTRQVFKQLSQHSDHYLYFPLIETETPEFITHLPEQTEKVEYRFDIIQRSDVVCLRNPVYVDNYAYLMYPLGVLSYLIDIPCSLLGLGYPAELIDWVYLHTH